jgi:predicted membrane-bound mannosyltransferase
MSRTPQHSTAIKQAVKGTVIAGVTWLALYLTKEHLGRTAALILAAVIAVLFVLVLWARLRLRAGNNPNPPAD